jgi:hypothetical protein
MWRALSANQAVDHDAASINWLREAGANLLYHTLIGSRVHIIWTT